MEIGEVSLLNSHYYLIVEVDAAHSDDVHLVGWVVKRPVKGTVVTDGRDHHDAVCSQLPDLEN